MMEQKQTHFKMYKIGRRWAFACAIILALGGASLTARADDNGAKNAESISSSVSSESQSERSSQDSKSSSQAQPKTDVMSEQQTQITGAKQTKTAPESKTDSDLVKQDDQKKSQANSETSKVTTDKNDATSQSSSSDQNVEKPAATSLKSDASANASSKTADTTPQSDKTTDSAKADNSAVKDGGNVEDDYADLHNILGVSSQFHIFAREAELNAHTNGNIAVGMLSGNVNFGTNIIEELLDKDISYIQNIDKIANSSFVSAGDTRVNKVIFGQNVDIDVSNPNRPKINGTDIDHLLASEVYQDKNGNVYIDFDKEFAKLEKLSGSMSNQKPHVNYTNSDFNDMNNRVIDITDLEPDENGHIIINLSADVLNGSTPLTIQGLSADKDGNTVIINVDTEGNQDYHINSQIRVIYDDGSIRDNKETEDFGDNHLLWNFYDSTASDQLATGVISVDRPFQGSILAPKAEVDANQNVDGNITANKVVVNAETHRWDLQDNVDNENDPEPEEPLDVEDPEEPEEPGDVEKPEEPGNVEEPEEPGETEKPEEPGNVEEPEEPGETEEPEEPGNVEEPEEPGETEEPEEPGNVEEPEQPGETEEPEAPVDVEEPEEPEDVEEPEQPGDIEAPEEEFEEEIDEEINEGVAPDEIVDEIEDEVEKEIDNNAVTDETADELETAFEEIQKEPVSEQSAEEETLLNLIDYAIQQAKDQHNDRLVAKLEGLRTQVVAALAAHGQGLPQTDESQDQWLSLAGVALASSLVLAAYGLRRKQNA